MCDFYLFTLESLNLNIYLEMSSYCRRGDITYSELYCSIFLIGKIEELKPIKIYSNLKNEKQNIKIDQKEKIGVYCLINLINGHIYIGSSINIANRMSSYLNNTYLKNKKVNNMPIVLALLKYGPCPRPLTLSGCGPGGQENFAIFILEYVDIESLAERETYFISTYLPYYNILKQGYSSLGYKHTEETKKKLSILAKNRAAYAVQIKLNL